MILDVEEAEERLNSADNLVNKMRLATSSSREVRKDFTELYGIANSEKLPNPVLPPSVDEIINDAEDKIKLGLAYSNAADVLQESIAMLSRNLVNIDPTKPQVLSRIALEMRQVITGINEVRNGGKAGNQNTQVIIYRPVMMNENHYESVQARE